MSLGDYLEKVDDGEDITVTDMYRNGDYQAVVEAVEYGSFSGADLEIDSDDADDLMGWPGLGGVRNLLETGISSVWDHRYDKGFNDGKEALENEDDNDLMSKKARRQDTKSKWADTGFAGGTGLGALGFSAGSIELGALGAGVGILSGYKGAEYQGLRDGQMKEAAKGLESAYGGFRLSIN
jgi:hypothetical protein